MKIIERFKKIKIIYVIGCYTNILIYNYIFDAYQYVKYFLRKKRLLKERKYLPLEGLKGKYEGKRCFIIATGPSLTMDDLKKLKNEYTFGLNSIVKVVDEMGYVPTFFTIQDSLVFNKLKLDIEKSNLNNIFLTDDIYNKINKKESINYYPYPVFSNFRRIHPDKLPLRHGFSHNPTNIVYSGSTVAYATLQIALYMGFSEIYLLGCDCSYNINGKQHFVESGHYDKNASSAGLRMINYYKYAVDDIVRYYPNAKVYNATRGGMLEVFPRKTLDDIIL